MTKERSCQIEHIQKQAMKIIFASNCVDYKNFSLVHKLDPWKLLEMLE